MNRRRSVWTSEMSMPVTDGETTDEGLRRALTRWHALAIVVGAVVGTGIYLRPASIAQLVQTPGRIAAVWIGAALISLAGAATYSSLASRFPRSGGEYAYLRETLGHFPAFMFGWMRLTLGAATVAALSVASAVFLSDLFPLNQVARRALPVLFIAVLATINVLGVANAGRFQSAVTTIKVIALAALIVAIFALTSSRGAGPIAAGDAAVAPVGLAAYASALLAALASFAGWTNVAMVGGEAQGAQRNLPWAMMIGIAIAAALYLLANVAYLRALPMSQVLTANSTAFPTAPSIASRAAEATIGASAGQFLALAFVVSALGALHCNLLAVPRVFFAMSRDGQLPAVFARLAPRRRTPHVAIIVMAGIAALFAMFGNYDRLTNMTSFGYILFYALTTYGYLRARRRWPARSGSRLVQLWIPRAFLAATAAILTVVIARGPQEIAFSIGLLGLGVPVYLFMRRRRLSQA